MKNDIKRKCKIENCRGCDYQTEVNEFGFRKVKGYEYVLIAGALLTIVVLCF